MHAHWSTHHKGNCHFSIVIRWCVGQHAWVTGWQFIISCTQSQAWAHFHKAECQHKILLDKINLLSKKISGAPVTTIFWLRNLCLLSKTILCLANFWAYRLYEIGTMLKTTDRLPIPHKLNSISSVCMFYVLARGVSFWIPCFKFVQPGPNSMALLTVSTESTLTEAGNSVLAASVFHRLAAKLGFCACVLNTPSILRLQG